MALLSFRGFDKEFLQEQHSLFVAEFAREARVPPESVTVELLPVEMVTDSPRSLEIVMFPVESKVHDAVAEMLYALLSHFGYPETHLFFHVLSPSLYYEEGRSAAESGAVAAETSAAGPKPG